jgi:hypothetical protein
MQVTKQSRARSDGQASDSNLAMAGIALILTAVVWASPPGHA